MLASNITSKQGSPNLLAKEKGLRRNVKCMLRRRGFKYKSKSVLKLKNFKDLENLCDIDGFFSVPIFVYVDFFRIILRGVSSDFPYTKYMYGG